MQFSVSLDGGGDSAAQSPWPSSDCLLAACRGSQSTERTESIAEVQPLRGVALRSGHQHWAGWYVRCPVLVLDS